MLIRASKWTVVLAVACVLGPSAAVAEPLLPDLVADAPVGGNAPIVYDDPQGARLLLRMDGFVHNRGPGPVEMRGSDPADGVMETVRQRVYDGTGGFTDIVPANPPIVIYETDDTHDHWHLRNAMGYSLWSENRSVEVAPSQKAGFCLVDSERVDPDGPADPAYTESSERFCEQAAPGAPSVFMGVSPGWRDIYSYVLAFQWIDISDVAPGRYWLRADADPDNVVTEADENNVGAYAAEASIVNGYRADPVAAGTVPALGPTEIGLAATTFHDQFTLESQLGAREFSIVTPPTGGTLDQPAGTWFSASSVQYTPRAGFHGPDAFTFAARDASTPFPRNPPSAAVTLTVDGASIDPEPDVLGISNAPRSVLTSSETQLTATGPGAEEGVTWTATAGTITPEGLYRAPGYVPGTGNTRIRARSATGAVGEVTVAIRRAPRPRPAPTIKPPPVPRRGLSKIKLRFHDRTLIAVASSAQRGRVRISAFTRGRRFGGCSVKVRRGGAVSCNLRTPRPRRIEVRAKLKRHGKTIAKRRAILR